MRVGAIGRLAAGRLAALGAVLLGLALAAGVPTAPAFAQVETREGIALQNQILELQREIQALQQQQAAPGYAAPGQYGQTTSPATSDIVTSLLSRVDNLEAAVRDLRGQVQNLTNELQQQTADLNKKIGDLQFQMQNGAAAAPGAAPTAGPLPMQPGAPPPEAAHRPAPAAMLPPIPPAEKAHAAGGRRTPELALRDGYEALSHRDYAAAEKDARQVLANRLSPHAAEAQYVLAQALLGQKKYSQAAIAFDDSYNRARKGPYASDSLLGLADSLVYINEKRAACDTLVKLRTEFPNQSQAVRERAAYAARRAGCH